MSKKLNWYEEIGEDDEPMWQAASIYHTDGDHFVFSITENDGVFYETSDFELAAETRRTWASLEAAQAALQADHDAMIAAETK